MLAESGKVFFAFPLADYFFNYDNLLVHAVTLHFWYIGLRESVSFARFCSHP